MTRTVLISDLPSEPSQPHEALAFYEGTWTIPIKGHEGFRAITASARAAVSARERGQRIANGFHFTSESGTGADRIRTRFTIVEAAEGRVNTVTEKARGDGPWVVDNTLQYLRARP